MSSEHEHQDQRHVEITIDGIPYKVHRGRITVAQLKATARPPIPPSYEMEEVIHKTLKPLPDDGFTTIQGGEVFIAHPRDGASS